MDGIVSLLDEDKGKWVEEMWALLDQEFGLRGIYITPFPHFTYHVAARYEIERLEQVLRRFTAKQAPIVVQTAGLGVFTGENPTVYIAIVRNAPLSQLHQALWQEIGNAGIAVIDYYRPDAWVPHITLAHGDVNNLNLPSVIRFLSKHQYYWQIAVRTISLIYSTGTEHGLRSRLDFPLGS